jgi:hypothetical protein
MILTVVASDEGEKTGRQEAQLQAQIQNRKAKTYDYGIDQALNPGRVET